MDKEKETMSDEQTVQPQEVENGTENKTVRKRISRGRILIATLIILLAGGASGAIGILYYITKDFQTLTCGIRDWTKCPHKHKFGEDLWGTMKCILCGRRLCKVDTDHEWRSNPYSPGRCSRCGCYATGSLYICEICGKTKSNVSLPCGGCDDHAKTWGILSDEEAW